MFCWHGEMSENDLSCQITVYYNSFNGYNCGLFECEPNFWKSKFLRRNLYELIFYVLSNHFFFYYLCNCTEIFFFTEQFGGNINSVTFVSCLMIKEWNGFCTILWTLICMFKVTWSDELFKLWHYCIIVDFWCSFFIQKWMLNCSFM